MAKWGLRIFPDYSISSLHLNQTNTIDKWKPPNQRSWHNFGWSFLSLHLPTAVQSQISSILLWGLHFRGRKEIGREGTVLWNLHRIPERPEEEPRGSWGPAHLTVFSPPAVPVHFLPSWCLSVTANKLITTWTSEISLEVPWEVLEVFTQIRNYCIYQWKWLQFWFSLIFFPNFLEERAWASLWVRLPLPNFPPVWPPMRKDGLVSPW